MQMYFMYGLECDSSIVQHVEFLQAKMWDDRCRGQQTADRYDSRAPEFPELIFCPVQPVQSLLQELAVSLDVIWLPQ